MTTPKIKTTKTKTTLKKKTKSFSDLLVASMVKDFGAGSVMRFGDKPLGVPVLCSSGYTPLDEIIGIGGYPVDRMTELWGINAGGKTTLALLACIQIQKKGGTAMFIDAENSLDTKYAEDMGVDMKKLIYCQITSGENAFAQIVSALKSAKSNMEDPEQENHKGIFIVVDSVYALTPKAQLEGDIDGDKSIQLGAHASMISKHMKHVTAELVGSNCHILWLNQVRTKFANGIMAYTDPTGGETLRFACHLRMSIKKKEKYEERGFENGHEFEITIKKNKVAPPAGVCRGLIRFSVGVDTDWHLFKFLQHRDNDCIKKEKLMKYFVDYPDMGRFNTFLSFRKLLDKDESNREKLTKLYNEKKVDSKIKYY